MKTKVGPSGRGWNFVLVGVAVGLGTISGGAFSTHIGESLDADSAFVSASDQMLTGLKQWERLPESARGARIAALVQQAKHRQDHLVALLQKNPQVAAARMMPSALRNRMPAQAAAYIEQEVSLEGRVLAHVADSFASGSSRTEFMFHPTSGGAPLKVHLADAAASEKDLLAWADKKLSMNAMRTGEHLAILDRKKVQLLSAGSTTTTGSGGSNLAAAGTVVQGNQNTLSILVNFSDKPMSCSTADVSNRLFGSSGATVNNNYRESSRGLVGFSGQVTGPYTINYASTGSCDYLGWGAAAEAAAKAAGIDPSLYTRVNYVTPANSNCGWSGLAYMPGRQSWVQSCSITGVFSHELGHNLSFNHAATPTLEYGDSSDPMGGAQLVDHNAANRTMAGWMPAGSVFDVSTGGSYALATISSAATATSPQVLRVAKPDTAESYYVSLRQAMNLDTTLPLAYLNTLSVHRAAGTLPTKTYLLQNLAAGQSFSDSVNGITITNQGVAGGTATVGVTLGATPCVRNAPAVSVSPASQTAGAGSALSYSISVTNQNSAACGASTFSLSQALPAGFSGTLAATTLNLSPGASGSSGWTVASASAVADATYTLTAAATDAASGFVGSAHASDIVYTAASCVRAAPSVSVSPSPQSGNAGSTLAYTVSVTNRNSAACGSSSFNLAHALPSGFSGSFSTPALSIGAGTSASGIWSVTSAGAVAAGTYTLTANATEATSGAATASASATDVVSSSADTTPPQVAFTSPAAGATVSGRTLTLAASASDASGIRAVEFYVDGSLLASDSASPYSASWNLRRAAAGVHTLKIRAIDNAGNAAEQTISVTK